MKKIDMDNRVRTPHIYYSSYTAATEEKRKEKSTRATLNQKIQTLIITLLYKQKKNPSGPSAEETTYPQQQ